MFKILLAAEMWANPYGSGLEISASEAAINIDILMKPNRPVINVCVYSITKSGQGAIDNHHRVGPIESLRKCYAISLLTDRPSESFQTASRLDCTFHAPIFDINVNRA